MNLLIDTHVILWLLQGDERLTARHIRLLEEADEPPMISAASFFEIAMKARKGKLLLPGKYRARPEALLDDFSFTALNTTPAHAALAGRLEGEHNDPFDRLLAAQSIAENIPVMTIDARIAELGAQVVW